MSPRSARSRSRRATTSSALLTRESSLSSSIWVLRSRRSCPSCRQRRCTQVASSGSSAPQSGTRAVGLPPRKNVPWACRSKRSARQKTAAVVDRDAVVPAQLGGVGGAVAGVELLEADEVGVVTLDRPRVQVGPAGPDVGRVFDLVLAERGQEDVEAHHP